VRPAAASGQFRGLIFRRKPSLAQFHGESPRSWLASLPMDE